MGLFYITRAQRGSLYHERARARQPELSAKISPSKFLACNHETLFTLLRARFEMFYTRACRRALALAKLYTANPIFPDADVLFCTARYMNVLGLDYLRANELGL